MQSIKSDSFLMNTLKRKPGNKGRKCKTLSCVTTDLHASAVFIATASELSSDAVIVLGNPLATGNNPFGSKKDKDLGLASTVLMY